MLWWTKRQLKSADAGTRKQAAEKLGRSRDRNAVLVLMGALMSDPEAAVREAAAEALGRLRDPLAADFLVSSLADRDPSVQQAAAEALVYIAADSTMAALGAWFEDHAGVREKIRAKLIRKMDEARGIKS